MMPPAVGWRTEMALASDIRWLPESPQAGQSIEQSTPYDSIEFPLLLEHSCDVVPAIWPDYGFGDPVQTVNMGGVEGVTRAIMDRYAARRGGQSAQVG